MSKYRLIYFAFIIFLVGFTFISRISIQQELMPYYTNFLIKVKRHCNEKQYNHPLQVEIHITDNLKYPVIGECSTTILGNYEIQFSKPFWEIATYQEKKILTAHELTHCLFYADHVKDPHHYMYYSLPKITEKELNDQVEQFLTERCGK